MMDSGYLINLSVLKIILSATWPWIYFFCDLDTLNDMRDFFLYDFMRSLIIFKNSVYDVIVFCLVLDLLELLVIFV